MQKKKLIQSCSIILLKLKIIQCLTCWDLHFLSIISAKDIPYKKTEFIFKQHFVYIKPVNEEYKISDFEQNMKFYFFFLNKDKILYS